MSEKNYSQVKAKINLIAWTKLIFLILIKFVLLMKIKKLPTIFSQKRRKLFKQLPLVKVSLKANLWVKKISG